ncbi:MAG TPA: NUDIX hydrolase [Bellilinea sp.]|nr:NUDIX hydrolase [Bellilinea sp.]
MAFKEKSRTQIYMGKAFNVEQVEMELPDGSSKVYDLVDHPNAVTILPVDDKQNVYFVRQFRLGSDTELLELPAGVLNDDEDPGEAALRELREETGMAGTLTLIGTYYLAPGYSNEKMFAYLATDLYTAPLSQDADEFLQLVKIRADKVYEMALSNQIHDSKTLSALLLAKSSIFGESM